MWSFLWCFKYFVAFCLGSGSLSSYCREHQDLSCCTISMTHGRNLCDPPWLFLPLGLQRNTACTAADPHELRIDSCRSLCVFHSCPAAAHYLCIQHCFLPAQRKHKTRTNIFPNNNVSGADTHCGLTSSGYYLWGWISCFSCRRHNNNNNERNYSKVAC